MCVEFSSSFLFLAKIIKNELIVAQNRKLPGNRVAQCLHAVGVLRNILAIIMIMVITVYNNDNNNNNTKIYNAHIVKH